MYFLTSIKLFDDQIQINNLNYCLTLQAETM